MSYEMAAHRVVKTKAGPRRVYVNDPVGLGFSFDPVSIAQAIQSGADKIESNIATGVSKLQTLQQKADSAVAAISAGATRAGAAVQGAAQGGIAAGATGSAGSGLTLAALTQKPALIAGGLALVYFVFLRHPGRKGW